MHEAQRVVSLGGKIHFLHLKADGPTGLPLILTYGWPSTFAEMIPLAHPLVDFGHDVVVPSLPGFTFSSQTRPRRRRAYARTMAPRTPSR